MDRFFNDDEDEKPFFKSEYDDDDDDDDLDDFEAETIAYIQNPMQFMQVGSNDNHLLDKAVEIASKHWLWRFKSAESKMNEIALIYDSLQIITGVQPELPEDPQEPPKE